MTDAALSRLSETNETPALDPTAQAIHYSVAMPYPESHLFEVTLHINLGAIPELPLQQLSFLDLKMPVWTPGSYLVREYARHLQDFSAQEGNNNQPLAWRKLSKNHWQVEVMGVEEITVNYRIFANELTVRTNHLDASHGYFNGAALFFYVPGLERHPMCVTIVPPKPSWRVTTTLPLVLDRANTFLAQDFDTLVDSPFEIGNHLVYDFEVRGKSHQLAIWGKGNADPDRLVGDMQKIIEVEADLFGGLPYDRYLFLLHLSNSGFGGLEHKDSCCLNYARFAFRGKEKYDRFVQLVAHEFFHLWNVKRLRPKGLEVFDYEAENYTPSLWFCEGTTSYYDLLIPLRAGIYDAKSFLQGLAKEITRLQMTPGRKVQSLNESSWDTWIKLYRRDANSDNSQISYYLKGEIVSLLLDLLIRQRHRNARSLDDVMREMWEQFGKQEIGFTPEQLQGVIESIAGVELNEFFARYIDGTEELPFEEYLEPFGLKLIGEEGSDTVYLGLTVQGEKGKEVIKFVEAGGPAQAAGVDAGDELLAIDGFRITAEQLSDRLQDYRPGDAIALTAFHQDELRTYQITLAAPRPTQYQILPVQDPTPLQQQNFAGWLGASLSQL